MTNLVYRTNREEWRTNLSLCRNADGRLSLVLRHRLPGSDALGSGIELTAEEEAALIAALTAPAAGEPA